MRKWLLWLVELVELMNIRKGWVKLLVGIGVVGFNGEEVLV